MKNTITSRYGLGLIAISTLCSALFTSHVQAASEDLLAAADPKVNKAYVRARFGKVQNKPFNANDPRPKLLILGDSQAQDFVNSAMEHDYLDKYQVRTRHIPAQCQLFLGDEADSGVADKDKALCTKVESLTTSKRQIQRADVIILASLWRSWAVKKLPQTIENLELRDNQKLIVLGRKSFGRVSLRHYLRMSDAQRKSVRNPIKRQFLNDNRILKQVLPPQVFVDQYTLICGAGQSTCPVFTPDAELISFDGGHLTKAGARYVGERIFTSPALSSL
ncbi:MAG: hypothetical protein CSB47_06940 [Proteobacteria bacterium]|nr:MAG: hypothetical protein CSB47_06940 [Pseudomonadota bacterium]